MSKKPKLSTIMRHLKEFEEAVDYMVFKGSYDPNRWEEVDEMYIKAKNRIKNSIKALAE